MCAYSHLFIMHSYHCRSLVPMPRPSWWVERVWVRDYTLASPMLLDWNGAGAPGILSNDVYMYIEIRKEAIVCGDPYQFI